MMQAVVATTTDLPEISLSHFLYVALWAVVGMAIGLVALPQSRPFSYKDALTGTLGASIEAIGIELIRGKVAVLFPLAVALVFALLIRFMPDDMNNLRLRRPAWQGLRVVSLIFTGYFFIQLFLLLLAYRGWLDPIVGNPDLVGVK